MGTANYYAKIYFSNSDKALIALPKIGLFFKECSEVVENPDMSLDKLSEYPAVEKYFKYFYEEELSSRFEREKSLNKSDTDAFADAFAEVMSDDISNVSDINGRTVEDLIHCVCEEASVRYSAEVWHFADWERVLNFVVQEYGAERQAWVSDEYINPFDVI